MSRRTITSKSWLVRCHRRPARISTRTSRDEQAEAEDDHAAADGADAVEAAEAEEDDGGGEEHEQGRRAASGDMNSSLAGQTAIVRKRVNHGDTEARRREPGREGLNVRFTSTRRVMPSLSTGTLKLISRPTRLPLSFGGR